LRVDTDSRLVLVFLFLVPIREDRYTHTPANHTDQRSMRQAGEWWLLACWLGKAFDLEERKRELVYDQFLSFYKAMS
jgi:hypothetical protein